MRITKRNLKGRDGEIALTPETLDDLWHLKYIIEPGDLVFALTKRKVEGATDKLRPEKMEKRPMRLGVRVESIEFHKFSNRLRLHGVIESGQEAGAYHTLNIENGTNLSVIKTWKNDQFERIKEAEAAAKRPRVVILTIEEGEASIGLVRYYGVEEYSNFKMGSGKGESSSREDFFNSVISQLSQAASSTEAVIVAGPGFTKDDFMKHLETKNSELAARSRTEDTVSIGISGFQEVLRRGAVDRIVEESRITREARLIEELMGMIATNGAAVYGWDEVKRARDMGAVESLLITDELLREGREKGHDIDAFLLSIEHSRGKVVVFSSEFEPGHRLYNLGGIAALLRFNLEY
ncbi:MAG: mRNA surveillance protein pelota [Nitrospirae bacterium]|nr:mRNA surveillance protein pelota [Nitrospirota bacterium]